MAGLIDVAVLPKGIRTVEQALDLLSGLPMHAFVTVHGSPRILHASDLLDARRRQIESINKVKGRSVAPVEAARSAPMGASANADDLRSVLAAGNADKVFGHVFKQMRTDYLLTAVDGEKATLLTRSEVLEYALSRAACQCSGSPPHLRDGQKSDSGKNCAVAGCAGTYTCY